MLELAKLSRELLPNMWDLNTRLFSNKTRIGRDDTYINERANPLYSAIALVGLLEDGAADGAHVSGLVGKTLDALHSVHGAGADFALGGCLMWAGALAEDSRTSNVLMRITRTLNVRRASSMELGLLIAGLVKCREHTSQLRDKVDAAIPEIRDELLGRFSGSGNLFRGVSPGRLATVREGRLTSYASQAYAIHGLAELARCVEGSVRPECAAAAQQLVKEQGSRGQWWWQYSRESGHTVEGYPVYSVHQDGMAFMALGTLHNLGHAAYDKPLWLGLRWLFGENELGESLVSQHPDMIFRCIQRRGSDADGISGMSRRNRMGAVLASVGLYPAAGTHAKLGTLEILRECRSYHLGWLLYANSIARAW
jgi:hypothetical protein